MIRHLCSGVLRRAATLALLASMAGLLGACNEDPTVVELRIDPPNADVRMTALFVVLINNQTQNQAQIQPFLGIEALTPPYTLNITPPEGQDLSQLTVQARVFGYYDNGRSQRPLTAFSTLDRFQFLPGIQTRYLQLDPLELSCGQKEGNSLGCLCRFDFGQDCRTNPDGGADICTPDTVKYNCYVGTQLCPDQTVLSTGLPGAKPGGICLPNDACPPGSVGCPCQGEIDATCDPPYVCQGGTCLPCQSAGCGCTNDSDCGGGDLVCAGRACCQVGDPTCTCFSQTDCEKLFPGQNASCDNNSCKLPGSTCNPVDTLLHMCTSAADCCRTPCIGGSCCRPGIDPTCTCKADSDCVPPFFPPGFVCSGGACQAPMMGCTSANGKPCCMSSSYCGSYPNVCIKQGCCNLSDGSCPCNSQSDCVTPEGLQLVCNSGSCAAPATDPCMGASGRADNCPCTAATQCTSMACCGLTGALMHCAQPTDPMCATTTGP
jgi:hypothetical protein